ncbi:DUF2062 domain-containing protein [Sneathiella aquimaris]|uniref:DUF2062 domain-containing protein n=1 Tax=Sneathiella aquimaris TaxID=2599305 RepID=UPI00146E410C|nr:DUF2062 domain-containing protein [Sneathiella aquimaris]
MFKRNSKPTTIMKVANFFWPSIGFKRSTQYLGYRLARLPGTPYSLAAGFAFGAAISFTPFVGFHFLLGGLLAWMFRANIIASAIGTAVGNPWTFPFIWTLIYKLGIWMLGRSGTKSSVFGADTVEHFVNNLFQNGWQSVSNIFGDVLFPMLIGSIPVFIVVWIIFFYPLRALIRKFHARRADALFAARSQRTPKEKTAGQETLDNRG